MNLTAEQQLISDAIYSYIEKPICVLNPEMRRKSTIVVNGSAGTGKTSSVTQAINAYCEEGNEDYGRILYIAPTHAAKGVIQSKTDCDCMTIHKALALKGDYKEDADGNLSKVFTVDETKSPPIHRYKIVVLDEGSMVDDDMEMQICKTMLPTQHLIVMQDALNQLPPPQQTTDTIFCNPNKYPNQYHLTKPMRFNTNSDIYSISSRLVGAIAQSKADVIRNESCNPKANYALDGYIDLVQIHNNIHKGVHIIKNPTEYFNQCIAGIKWGYENNKPDHAVACAYTNATVNQMNTKIRNSIIHNAQSSPYMVGDWITIRMNSDDWYNGDKCVVLSIEPAEYNSNSAEANKYQLRFNYYKLHIRRLSDGREGDICALGKGYGDKKSYDNSMGRWADDIHKMPKTTKGMAWRSWFHMKEVFHIPDYSYCTTVHLQQGNTVDNIYVLEFDITHNKDGKLYRDNTNQLRLMYVAYTRARENVYICNPNFTH